MKEIIIKAYSFQELSEKAQQRVLDRHSEITHYDGWHDDIIGEFELSLKDWGVEDPRVAYSGFYSQGDGACFYSKNIDLAKLFYAMSANKYFDIPDSWMNAAVEGSLTVSIVKFDRRYEHSKTIGADARYVGETLSEDEIETIESVIITWARDLSDELYSSLEKEWESLTSQEAIIEEIAAREWLFTENGQLINVLG